MKHIDCYEKRERIYGESVFSWKQKQHRGAAVTGCQEGEGAEKLSE